MRNFKSNDPRVITAKFDSVCRETGGKIKKGTECLYYPADKAVYTMNSKQAKDYLDMKFDEEYLTPKNYVGIYAV